MGISAHTVVPVPDRSSYLTVLRCARDYDAPYMPVQSCTFLKTLSKHLPSRWIAISLSHRPRHDILDRTKESRKGLLAKCSDSELALSSDSRSSRLVVQQGKFYTCPNQS